MMIKPWKDRLPITHRVIRVPEHRVYTCMEAEIKELRSRVLELETYSEKLNMEKCK